MNFEGQDWSRKGEAIESMHHVMINLMRLTNEVFESLIDYGE